MLNESVARLDVAISVLNTFVIEKGAVHHKRYTLAVGGIPLHLEEALRSKAAVWGEREKILLQPFHRVNESECFVAVKHLEVVRGCLAPGRDLDFAVGKQGVGIACNGTLDERRDVADTD